MVEQATDRFWQAEAAFLFINQLLILPQNCFNIIGMASIAPINTCISRLPMPGSVCISCNP